MKVGQRSTSTPEQHSIYNEIDFMANCYLLARMGKILRWTENIWIEDMDGNIITQLHWCELQVVDKTAELQEVRQTIASKSGVQSPHLKKAPPMWEETPNEVIQNNWKYKH